MDLHRIKALIDLVSASAISELEIVEGGVRVRILRNTDNPAAASSAVTTTRTPEPTTRPPEAPAPHLPGERVVVAPMFGVLHLTPMPDAPPLVEVGQTVQPGQRVAVIEAMKVFNDVVAEMGGRVAEIVVGAGEEVEAGQPILRLT